MFRLATFTAAAALAAFLVGPAWAGHGPTGNGAPAGPHYTLNIIGVDSAKTQTLTDSKRRTIFVKLGRKGSAQKSNIWLTQGDFEVCDGNAFDDAFDCDGTQIGRNETGAVFQLPCNDNPNIGLEESCVTGGGRVVAEYEVWARALGSPTNEPEVSITLCAFDAGGTKFCNTGGDVAVLVRKSGQPLFNDVTQELTTIRVDFGVGLKRFPLFFTGLEDYVWEYNNQGVRLAQLRFYLLEDIK